METLKTWAAALFKFDPTTLVVAILNTALAAAVTAAIATGTTPTSTAAAAARYANLDAFANVLDGTGAWAASLPALLLDVLAVILLGVAIRAVVWTFTDFQDLRVDRGSVLFWLALAAASMTGGHRLLYLVPMFVVLVTLIVIVNRDRLSVAEALEALVLMVLCPVIIAVFAAMSLSGLDAITRTRPGAPA